MGVHDLHSGVDVERARYERENRLNPPEFAPGQDLSPVSAGDLFGNQGGSNLFSGGGNNIFDNSPQDVNTGGMSDSFGGDPFGSDPFGSDPFGSSFGGDSFGGGNPFGAPQSSPFGASQSNPFGASGFNTGNNFGPSANGMIMPNQQQQQGFTYEKAEAMAKTTVSGLKSLGASFKTVTPLFWYNYCRATFKVGLAFLGVGLLMGILSVGNAYSVIIAGAIVGVGCLGTAMIIKDKATTYPKEYNTVDEVPVMPTMPMEMPTQFASMETDSFDTPMSNDFDFPDETNMGLDTTEEETEPEISLDDIEVQEEPPKVSPEEALKELTAIPQGMYTRTYLYDAFTKVLPSISNNFAKLNEIMPSDKSFYDMEAIIQEAAEVTGCKETVEVQKVEENYATIIVTTSRPTGLKLDTMAEELARIYAYRAIANEDDRNRVYAKAEAVGRTCIFTIFTGAVQMISLKDMYSVPEVHDYVLDSKHYIPIVFGIDSLAKVIYYDLKDLESIIIAGMPRSGKSWFVQNMLTQMTAYLSPKQLHLYICDPKDDISDFKSFTLPHVKRFVTTDEKIMNTLRGLVKMEAPRRTKIIGEHGYVNIWDFKARYPDVDMPIIYVVIDEVVTLASRMDKETLADFRAILRELISRLPALGIRAILIPHVLKNDIIEKKTSDIVLCRISVCGKPDHIESVTGAKEKQFPYKLSKPGDMAVSIPPINEKVMYLRAPVLTKSNPENNELFDYMRRVWTSLEPDSIKDSVAQGIEESKVLEECLTTESDMDALDIFGTEDDAYDKATQDFIKTMNS